MPNGRVKWFNNSKGYGFILADGGGEDLFVHYSSIQMEGYRTLKAGEPVAFDTVPAERGFHAVAVHRLEAPDAVDSTSPCSTDATNPTVKNSLVTPEQSTQASAD